MAGAGLGGDEAHLISLRLIFDRNIFFLGPPKSGLLSLSSMRIFQCCWLLLVCISLGAHAQTNFQPGYVVSATGDTIRGEVDLRDSRTSAQHCRFRPSPPAAVVDYAPGELRAYGYPARHLHYRAFTVPVEDEPAQLRFLEVLVDGTASLYFLRDETDRQAYYVLSPSVLIAQLRHGYVMVQSEGHNYTEEQTSYRNTLAKALVGCASAMTRLPRLSYSESALHSVVVQYNNCHNEPAASTKEHAGDTHVFFGLMGGVAHQRLNYSGFPYVVIPPSPASHTGFVVGPTLRISSRRLSEKVFLVVSLLYEPEKFEVSDAGPYSTNYISKFDLAYLRAPLLVRYTLPKQRIAPFFEAGVDVGYALKTTTKYYINPIYVSTPPLSRVLLPGDSFRKVQFAAVAGAGICFRAANGRNTAILLRTEIDNGFSSAANIVHLYGMVSFDLTK